ncbi:hypothetical protein AMTR_s00142p00045620 [Amborella trichopoda]|uniref:Uncharacterized protein n=1 Tax=Amborella trichopoda TaxID=13333 RepID=W1PDJ5_AMBTC|nr:hypothetical protein AMTR_s00142p00045620 [Amborella trichopoda]
MTLNESLTSFSPKSNPLIMLQSMVAKNQDEFTCLVTVDIRANKLDRAAIDLDESLASFEVGHHNCYFLSSKAVDGFHSLSLQLLFLSSKSLDRFSRLSFFGLHG